MEAAVIFVRHAQVRVGIEPEDGHVAGVARREVTERGDADGAFAAKGQNFVGRVAVDDGKRFRQLLLDGLIGEDAVRFGSVSAVKRDGDGGRRAGVRRRQPCEQLRADVVAGGGICRGKFGNVAGDVGGFAALPLWEDQA